MSDASEATGTIGFMGLGSMGAAMARVLLDKGYRLRVYNRSAKKTRPLADAGAIVCDTPAEAAQGAFAVVSMLTDDAAVEHVTVGDEGILTGMASDAVHLSASTISPEMARRLAALHDLHDSHYLATPVFGRPEAAAAGKLNILISGGEAALRARVRPLLETMGQGVWDFGDEPEAANVVKLCGNFLIFAATEAMVEAFTLAEKNGVGRTAIYEMLTKSIFASPIYQNYGRMVASEVFQPVGFTLPLGPKICAWWRTWAAPRIASLIDEKMTTSLAKGSEDEDAAVFAREASSSAGLRR